MKSQKRIFTAVCIALLFFAFLLPGVAAPTSAIPAKRLQKRLVDSAALLDALEENELLSTLNEISARQKCDVVIVTVDPLDGKTATEYADDFFDYNGYGYGKTRDGILLLISMAERDWALSTHGWGIEVFTDAGQAYIMDDFVLPCLLDDDFYGAFTEFAAQCDAFLTQAAEDEPYDSHNLPGYDEEEYYEPDYYEPEYYEPYDPGRPLPGFNPISYILQSIPVVLFISVGAGLLLAFVVMLLVKQPLKSVRRQANAHYYARSGSLYVTAAHERFLYRNVSRTAIPRHDDTQHNHHSGGMHGGASAGGSSTHVSSSGSTHGGSSGKF